MKNLKRVNRKSVLLVSIFIVAATTAVIGYLSHRTSEDLIYEQYYDSPREVEFVYR